MYLHRVHVVFTSLTLELPPPRLDGLQTLDPHSTISVVPLYNLEICFVRCLRNRHEPGRGATHSRICRFVVNCHPGARGVAKRRRRQYRGRIEYSEVGRRVNGAFPADFGLRLSFHSCQGLVHFKCYGKGKGSWQMAQTKTLTFQRHFERIMRECLSTPLMAIMPIESNCWTIVTEASSMVELRSSELFMEFTPDGRDQMRRIIDALAML